MLQMLRKDSGLRLWLDLGLSLYSAVASVLDVANKDCDTPIAPDDDTVFVSKIGPHVKGTRVICDDFLFNNKSWLQITRLGWCSKTD